MTYRFLIYISYSYAIPIGLPLEMELRKRGYDVWWFSNLADGMQVVPSESNLFTSIKSVIHYDPHIILTITDTVPDFLRGLKVQVFHGFNAEKRTFKKDHFRIRGLFDLYCTQGPSTTSIFKQQQEKYGHFEVIETGWSKVDPLFPLVETAPSTPPTVFIATTFTPRLSLALNNDIFKEIKRLSENGSFQFIMVMHPKLPEEIVEKWKSLQNNHFKFYDTTNLIPLMQQADLMFSDTTSAIQEFGLQEKPIVTFDHYIPKEHLMNINEVNQIEPALREAATLPKKIMEKLATFNEQLHPYKDGRSSERIIDACIEYVHAPKDHLKKKPFNLIRKYKIRQQLDYTSTVTFDRAFVMEDVVAEPIKLSAVIITYNEEEHLDKCLTSLRDVADEIVVVDSYSTDGTEAICRRHNVKFIQQEFLGYIEQKNFAITQTKYPYLLSLDGDEALSEELKASILALKSNWKHDAYYIKRRNNYCGKWIRHSDWYPDKKIRLAKKNAGEWKGINPHDSFTLDKKKSLGKLKGDLLHWIYRDYEEHNQKVENFSTISARSYYERGKRSNIFKIIFRPSWAFFKAYFLRLGFLDGLSGLIICLQTFNMTFLKYIKLYEIQQQKKLVNEE